MHVLMTASDLRSLSIASRLAYARPAVWRCDVARELVNGRYQSWRERLNRAVFAARSWAGMETIRARELAVLRNRRVRCEVYEANL